MTSAVRIFEISNRIE